MKSKRASTSKASRRPPPTPPEQWGDADPSPSDQAALERDALYVRTCYPILHQVIARESLTDRKHAVDMLIDNLVDNGLSPAQRRKCGAAIAAAARDLAYMEVRAGLGQAGEAYSLGIKSTGNGRYAQAIVRAESGLPPQGEITERIKVRFDALRKENPLRPIGDIREQIGEELSVSPCQVTEATKTRGARGRQRIRIKKS